MKNDDFPVKNGDLSIKNSEFPVITGVIIGSVPNIVGPGNHF